MMSIPLLSVCLATLMALFRDPDLSTLVSQDNLTLLIRETGTALLDSRLSSSSDLDEATGSQMVRAINKVSFCVGREWPMVHLQVTHPCFLLFPAQQLAVQAATSATRHSSLLSLMTLQHQLSRESPESAEDEAFTSRLSRVVSKLFTRVIRAEEAAPDPFSVAELDLEVIVCWMEDLLGECDDVEAETGEDSLSACRDMVQSLVEAIVKAHNGPEYIEKQLDALGIERHSSALGRLLEPFEPAPPDVVQASSSLDSQSFDPEPASGSPSKSGAKDVATLVSAIVTAPVGPQRDAALDALRQYKAMNGDEELNAHLTHVSSAFRSFIEEQLGVEADGGVTADKGDSMTDRLASLRSRLQATELAVQNAVEEDPVAPEAESSLPKTASPSKIPSPGKRSTTRSRLAQPSPSKIPTPSRLPTASASQSLRERLAMAQENRRGESSSGIGSSMGRAAALRARLEAVKKKGKDGAI